VRKSRVQVEKPVVGFLDGLGGVGETLAIRSFGFPVVERMGSDIDEPTTCESFPATVMIAPP
jgi:hypothetical protein